MQAKRVRLPAEDRRREIVECAFALLAQQGFEGLRTRDVADRVGINSATLHHYFPTKEDLVAAVAKHLAERFRTEKAPRRLGKRAPRALAALREELAGIGFYRRQSPEMLAVYRELTTRAERDEAMRVIVASLTDEWRASIAQVLNAGVDDGTFRSDLNIPSSATLIVSALWGATLLFGLSDGQFEKMCTELERALAP